MNYPQRVAAAFRATLTRQWWTEFLEAAWRQCQQYAAPFLLVVITSGAFDVDAFLTVLLALGTAVAVVLVRRLAAITAPEGSGPGVDLVFRVVSAFTGAVAGFLTVDGADLLNVSWPTILTASAATAVLAVLDGKVDPAASVVRDDAHAGGNADHHAHDYEGDAPFSLAPASDVDPYHDAHREV